MRQFYTVTQKLHDLLIADNNVNVVTIGDVSEADLAKQSIFPLAHIIVGDTSLWLDNDLELYGYMYGCGGHQQEPA